MRLGFIVGKVKIWEGMGLGEIDAVMEAVETHDTSGLYKSNIIRCIEAVGDLSFRESQRGERYATRFR